MNMFDESSTGAGTIATVNADVPAAEPQRDTDRPALSVLLLRNLILFGSAAISILALYAVFALIR